MVRLYLVVEVEPEDGQPATQANAQELSERVTRYIERGSYETEDERTWFIEEARLQLLAEAH